MIIDEMKEEAWKKYGKKNVTYFPTQEIRYKNDLAKKKQEMFADLDRLIEEARLDSNSRLSNDEIKQDITDTEAEIETERLKVEGYEKLVVATAGTLEYKMNCFRRDAAQRGVQERIKFVAFLNRLLQARKEK